MKSLINLLTSMTDLLIEEKEALINNDGDRINDIVSQKNIFIKELEKYGGKNLSKDREVVRMIKEIDQLQETNLMLTNQAMAYNNLFLDALKDITKDRTSGYSKDGKLAETRNKSIVDQSV